MWSIEFQLGLLLELCRLTTFVCVYLCKVTKLPDNSHYFHHLPSQFIILKITILYYIHACMYILNKYFFNTNLLIHFRRNKSLKENVPKNAVD